MPDRSSPHFPKVNREVRLMEIVNETYWYTVDMFWIFNEFDVEASWNGIFLSRNWDDLDALKS